MNIDIVLKIIKYLPFESIVNLQQSLNISLYVYCMCGIKWNLSEYNESFGLCRDCNELCCIKCDSCGCYCCSFHLCEDYSANANTCYHCKI